MHSILRKIQAEGSREHEEAGGEEAGGEEAAEEEEVDPNAGKIPEEIRDAWKDLDAEGNERVLCDQGDSALWLDAQAHFKGLKEDHAAAVEAK